MTRGAGPLLIVIALLAGSPAAAQTSITLNADPVPIVDAELDGKPARLEVHLRFSESLLLNQSAADRLGIRPALVGRRVVSADGATQLRGRPIRPRIVINGRQSRALAGVFTTPVTARADGIIGPPALPFDTVTVVLGPERPGMRDITLPLATDQRWTASGDVGGHSMFLQFDVSQRRSIISRSASRLFDGEGAIVADGAQTNETIILGLSTRVQPVRTELRAFGLAIAPAVARTDAPLLGEAGADIVVVESTRPPPPGVTIGREALSRCSSIRSDRPARTMTLRCAA